MAAPTNAPAIAPKLINTTPTRDSLIGVGSIMVAMKLITAATHQNNSVFHPGATSGILNNSISETAASNGALALAVKSSHTLSNMNIAASIANTK